MLTLEVDGRQPLLGVLRGNLPSDSAAGQGPYIELSSLGEAVAREWRGIPQYYPKIEVLALQIMPDHLHGILLCTSGCQCIWDRLLRDSKWVVIARCVGWLEAALHSTALHKTRPWEPMKEEPAKAEEPASHAQLPCRLRLCRSNSPALAAFSHRATTTCCSRPTMNCRRGNTICQRTPFAWR